MKRCTFLRPIKIYLLPSEEMDSRSLGALKTYIPINSVPPNNISRRQGVPSPTAPPGYAYVNVTTKPKHKRYYIVFTVFMCSSVRGKLKLVIIN